MVSVAANVRGVRDSKFDDRLEVLQGRTRHAGLSPREESLQIEGCRETETRHLKFGIPSCCSETPFTPGTAVARLGSEWRTGVSNP